MSGIVVVSMQLRVSIFLSHCCIEHMNARLAQISSTQSAIVHSVSFECKNTSFGVKRHEFIDRITMMRTDVEDRQDTVDLIKVSKYLQSNHCLVVTRCKRRSAEIWTGPAKGILLYCLTAI